MKSGCVRERMIFTALGCSRTSRTSARMPLVRHVVLAGDLLALGQDGLGPAEVHDQRSAFPPGGPAGDDLPAPVEVFVVDAAAFGLADASGSSPAWRSGRRFCPRSRMLMGSPSTVAAMSPDSRSMRTVTSSAEGFFFRIADNMAASRSSRTVSRSMFLSLARPSTMRKSSWFISVPGCLGARRKARKSGNKKSGSPRPLSKPQPVSFGSALSGPAWIRCSYGVRRGWVTPNETCTRRKLSTKLPAAGAAELALRLATGLDPGQAQHSLRTPGLMVSVTIVICTLRSPGHPLPAVTNFASCAQLFIHLYNAIHAYTNPGPVCPGLYQPWRAEAARFRKNR